MSTFTEAFYEMKKWFILILFCLPAVCFGQQFSFQLSFIDSIGNKDSLALGYDVNASDTIDTSFGEINIISTPYNSNLDVRVGNLYWLKDYGHGELPFQTKKQIVPNNCGTYLISPIEIDVVAHHWPVKAYWSKEIFNDPCRNGSVFTGVDPGGWWDTGGFKDTLKTKDSVTFYPNQYYFATGKDTIPVYWIGLGDSTMLNTLVGTISKETPEIKISPNPFSSETTLYLNPANINNSQLKLFDLTGREVQIHIIPKGTETFTIKRNNLPDGIYFYKLITSGNPLASGKLVIIK